MTWLSLLASSTAESSDNGQSLLLTFAFIVIGSGTGGLIGAVITWRRFKLEQKSTEVKNRVDLQHVDVEQFKAMFPGGLGDAVEHWRDEAKGLYVEVDDLRGQRQADRDEIRALKRELATTQRQLEHTVTALHEAEERIKHLEGLEAHE